MTLFLVLGLRAVLRGRVRDHGAWMMRAYALGIGAGTQVLTHIPWFLFPSIRGEFWRTVFMASAWVINILIAEWMVRKRPDWTGVGPAAVHGLRGGAVP